MGQQEVVEAKEHELTRDIENCGADDWGVGW